MEIVRRSFEAFNLGDLEAVLDDLAPEFEFRPSGRFMDMQPVYRRLSAVSGGERMR